MPITTLKISAETENIDSIVPLPDTIWRVKVKCTSCGEPSPKFLEIDASNEEQIPGGRGVANCVYSCKFCKRVGSLSIDQKSLVPVKSFEKKTPIVQFDCRGIEPCEWQPANGFNVVSTGETVFEDVDLSEEFADFDENLGEAVNEPVAKKVFTLQKSNSLSTNPIKNGSTLKIEHNNNTDSDEGIYAFLVHYHYIFMHIEYIQKSSSFHDGNKRVNTINNNKHQINNHTTNLMDISSKNKTYFYEKEKEIEKSSVIDRLQKEVEDEKIKKEEYDRDVFCEYDTNVEDDKNIQITTEQFKTKREDIEQYVNNWQLYFKKKTQELMELEVQTALLENQLLFSKNPKIDYQLEQILLLMEDFEKMIQVSTEQIKTK
ncbi:hypothetical protein WA158_003591 [Blastocystis sp. Blastoise]